MAGWDESHPLTGSFVNDREKSMSTDMEGLWLKRQRIRMALVTEDFEWFSLPEYVACIDIDVPRF